MRNQSIFNCDFIKACRVKYAVRILGWSQTKTAIILGLNVGTVSHMRKRLRGAKIIAGSAMAIRFTWFLI
jgi:hypothetical protein